MPARVIIGDTPPRNYDAEIVDISEGGAFLHCDAPVQLGERIRVELRFGETKIIEGSVIQQNAEFKAATAGPDMVEVSVVRWARGTRLSGIGVEFAQLSPEKFEFLRRIMHYFSQVAKAGADLDKP